ncbi:MAG: ribosome silencing factor [Anaerolineae bacterium]|nr:ribosome silencing factor [Anaerolineae bacterium]
MRLQTTKSGGLFLDSLDLAHHIVDAIEAKKAENIVLLDLRPDAIIADFFIICTGNSDRQIRAIADGVREAIKENDSLLPVSVEGESHSGWVLMDYGDVIVHIFGEEQREFYNLEGFWKEANVLLSIQ